MTKKLFFSAVLKFLLGVVLVGVLIFLPAGTVNFFNGWLFMCILFIPMLFAGIVMMIKNPELLKKRLKAKENEKEQGVVIKLSGLMLIIGFATAGLNYRFGGICFRPRYRYRRRWYFSFSICYMPRFCVRTPIFQEP